MSGNIVAPTEPITDSELELVEKQRLSKNKRCR